MVWRIWGKGSPLLLLHGATGSWMHWIRNILPLAEHFRVIAPDLPGFGDSDDPPDPQSFDSLLDVVTAGIERVVPPPETARIAGFSFGGIVGGCVAARLGTQVHTLVLSGAGGMGITPSGIPPLARTHRDMGPAELAAVHRENLSILMFADRGAIDDLAVHIQKENVRRARFKSGSIPVSDRLLQALPDIRARIGGIWGERDVFAAPDVERRGRILADVQPSLDFRVIEGAGHWVPYEAADEVNAVLFDMLAEPH